MEDSYSNKSESGSTQSTYYSPKGDSTAFYSGKTSSGDKVSYYQKSDGSRNYK